QRAVTLLANAQRPVLLAGGGVIDADASKEAVALAELLDMALVPSYGHTDAVPNSHHLYVGPPGGRGSAEAAEALHRADVILALGLAYDRLRFELPRTFFNYAGHGGLGMGYCVGLGTKLGRPDRPAVSLQGDGGFLYTSQEINTAVRWGIPLVSIVLNNSCHG